MYRQCGFHLGDKQCKRNSSGVGKCCVYHTRGGKKLYEGSFFSFTAMATVEPETRPVKGDIRMDEITEVCFQFDGSSWRRLCPLCTALARPVYCIKHRTEQSQKQQTVSCECFDALEKELGCRIIHYHWKNNPGEIKIPGCPYRVDGYRPGTTQIFEFLGDFYHGNPALFDAQAVNPLRHTTYGDIFQQTMSRLDDLADLGYEVYYIWESDYKRWKSNDGTTELMAQFHHHLSRRMEK